MKETLDSKEKLLDELNEKMDYLIKEDKQKNPTQIIDILTAILLSLATVGSAWCAYQSTLWNGVQTFELMDAGKAGRLTSENTIKAVQIRSMDGILLMEFINASKAGDKELADFYFNRFDTALKTATLEWLKKDPFNNVNAPRSPMKMESYKLKEEAEAINQFNINLKQMESANSANNNSDRYVLLTVLFAGVLFFAGIANTLKSNLMRNICLLLSAIIFLMTAVFLINMPVTSI